MNPLIAVWLLGIVFARLSFAEETPIAMIVKSPTSFFTSVEIRNNSGHPIYVLKDSWQMEFKSQNRWLSLDIYGVGRDTGVGELEEIRAKSSVIRQLNLRIFDFGKATGVFQLADVYFDHRVKNPEARDLLTGKIFRSNEFGFDSATQKLMRAMPEIRPIASTH